MDKTQSRYLPKAFTLTVQPRQSLGCRLYLYDAAGEDYTEEDRMAGHRFQQFMDAAIFVLDPFAEPGIRDELSAQVSRAEIQRTNPASATANEILARLVSRLENVTHVSAGGRFPIPVAVVLTKGDACGLEGRLGEIQPLTGAYLGIAAAAGQAARQADAIRQFLAGAGLGNFLRILDTRFARVSFFLTSALAPARGASPSAAITPRGVSAPLIWVGYYSQALTGATTLQQICRNFWITLTRSVRGQEGTGAQLVAWAALTCAAAVLTCSIWYGLASLWGATSVR
jgi:hypothetical protein